MHAPCALVNIPCTPTDKQNDVTLGHLIAADHIQLFFLLVQDTFLYFSEFLFNNQKEA
jgi:hypothetical protein